MQNTRLFTERLQVQVLLRGPKENCASVIFDRGFYISEKELMTLAQFQNPGALFMGTMSASEQKFLKQITENAFKNGYKRFVEPCAGAFALSHLARQAGFKAKQIETSDVSMFSTILGYTITGQSLDTLCIKAKGFTDEELLDPATALYAWKYLNMAKKAGQDYFYNYLVDLEQRREVHINSLRA